MRKFVCFGGKITAKQLYEQLLESGIKGAKGEISAKLLGVSVMIKEKSATGDIIQEWLGSWMAEKKISYGVQENSQEFPDFFLDTESTDSSLLEIKTFDYTRSPNFDIANFEAYVRSLITHPYRLEADYLIIGYELEEGVLKVNDIWLKKIWELTCPSDRFHLKTQVKQDVIYNIRPRDWRSTRSHFPSFSSRKEFIEAIQNTLNKYPKTKGKHENWAESFYAAYEEHFGYSLHEA